jgi:phosphoribosylglycinamide formyltransferase-1
MDRARNPKKLSFILFTSSYNKPMKKIVVLFSGTGSNLKYILENMHQKELEVVLAITNNPGAKGIEIAKSYGIDVEIIPSKEFSKREEFDKVLVERISKVNPDLTVLAGFMRILTPTFTSKIRAINLHPSLLPRHKGLKAIERSFEDNFEDGGVSIHWVSEELDGGEIILQKSIKKSGLSFEEYHKNIRKIEKEALVEAIRFVLKI